ncbi:Cytochrome c-type biogenesis protein CcmE, heme chaperone [Lutibaculum baratangense AMV1]|uniref:Cytochrome c-type biogenesis protein CcmE n=1 Tax=Lutibaculum baratangense AMV1 TaxID=631454 RepID=V4RBM9_9HYPH|nr:Cytochrome c-type biogenesis protein CcmE, heme chaperone [Lutibaculum baratangense AMV1]
MTLIGAAGVVLAAAIGLILVAFQDTIVFFNSPSDILAEHPGTERRIRLGGLVLEGSVVHDEQASVRFVVTDTAHDLPVVYGGLLPDLFREGQGIVAEGRLDADGVFRADSVLAKHDETYMPPEVADALKKQGHFMEAATQ